MSDVGRPRTSAGLQAMRTRRDELGRRIVALKVEGKLGRRDTDRILEEAGSLVLEFNTLSEHIDAAEAAQEKRNRFGTWLAEIEALQVAAVLPPDQAISD